MQNFPPDLSGLTQPEAQAQLRQIGEELGFSEPLDQRHAGVFVEDGDVLLVSFENLSTVESASATHTPFGFEMVARENWSCLSVLSQGDTWFRSPQVYDFFDQLTDDGFFDEFNQVIFFGSGPAAYAACAYSVAAPGAKVIALQPQASLDPRCTEWDNRFIEQRRLDFTSRYGYAPDMLEGADQAHVLYDPNETLDAMHAALFNRSNVTRHRLPFQGAALQSELQNMDILSDLVLAVAEDKLTRVEFAAMMRARRNHNPYLRRLLTHLEQMERDGLTYLLCKYVTGRGHAPRFKRKLERLKGKFESPQDQLSTEEMSAPSAQGASAEG